MNKILGKLRRGKMLGKIFHTLDYCLQKELKDCESVLDLGCGPSSPIKYCKNIKHSVGVEAFKPYLDESKKQQIHTEYVEKRIEEVDFPENSFDAVVMTEVLEHLPKELGKEILKKAEAWARKKIIVSTPNGYFPMGAVDENNFQRHLSGWTAPELKNIGFEAYGTSGAKFLYLKENAVHSLVDQSDNVFSNMRFKPKKLFYFINAILQIFVYYKPQFAFGLFLVKRKNV